MKKILFLASVMLASVTMQAQIATPAPSPASKLQQTVGLTEVTVEYSRPSMRGRTIFGGLLEYGKLWRTGANARTKVTFSDDVKVDGQELKAGSYALYTKPGKTSWEVFFYTEADGGGTPKEWDDSKVAAKTTAQVYQLPVDIETFTITWDDLGTNTANLGLMWERTYVAVPVEFPTDSKVMASIEKTMAGSPKADDYYGAAVYYSSEGKDIKKASEWMDKAMSMIEEPAFWQLRQQSLIQAKSGDKKAAIKTAKKSLKKAKEAGNDDYVKMNTESIEEWKR
ncbi:MULTISPECIES: DUF2911 domain-containing protein [Zobellia]|uniref:Conserved hypothetical periplasmic protein n=1 Tax=Zobellia galactanivorans (strain DSM 12802 / CCUG 47099 / CIP 106680 / NCIMB 13871 / Dsij) TaxID=63186 RepID=G0L2F6_ZOBGA|nr:MULTISPECIES: DUF2911 domain-containing protein [Zobellia]MBU3026307.1 DUF2911 domain-containing protein [Zobellia galactanivorans]OWW25509.1 dihydrolipoamide dehydrogenase [Zobellia sp. OII3]CAZ98112.1 Conserved hypothetical periplasmic protein [Zobellia galactanivorans]